MSHSSKPRRWFKHDGWNECISHFLDACTSPLTRVQYTAILRRFFADPKKTPDKYTRQEVEAFLAQGVTLGPNKGQPISAYTRNHYMSALKSFYNYCTQYYVTFRDRQAPILRGHSPVAGVKLTKTGQPDRDLTDEELRQFFASIQMGDGTPMATLISLRDRALFLFYFWSGRRRAEVANLRWRDLEETTFEDGHTGWIYKWKGKGRMSRDDSAELPAPAFTALKAYLVATGRWEQMQPETPLFIGLTGPAKPDQPLNSNGIDRRFRKYARMAELPDEKCVHSLRYAAAWERYEANGHNPLAVMADLRHNNIQTTMKYLHKRTRKKQADTVAPKLYGKWGQL